MCPVTSHTMFCYIAGLYVRLTHNELLYEENLKCLQSDNVPPQLQSNLQTTQTSVCTITHTHTHSFQCTLSSPVAYIYQYTCELPC